MKNSHSFLIYYDTYYFVPIRNGDRKYLHFEHEGQLYEFACLANGLSSASRIFTKLLKPALARLREDGVLLVIYIDDIILLPMTLRHCSVLYKGLLHCCSL